MLTNIYRVGSPEEAYRVRDLLRGHEIEAKIIGDLHANRGPKVSYFVEIAVEESEAELAAAILANDEASRERDISHLTCDIRRKTLRFLLVIAALCVVLELIQPGSVISILPYALVIALIVLPFLGSSKNRRANDHKPRRHKRKRTKT